MYRVLFFALVIFCFSSATAQEIKHVDSKTFSTLIKSGDGIILDVRTEQEYSRGHIENATLISTSDPKFVEKVSLLQKEKPLYIYCLTGSRSYAVANYLSKNGYSKIYNLRRGLMEWQSSNYPIIQNNNPIASTSKVYTEAEFKKMLNENNLVLLDFHAQWCAPCKKMSPIIEELQKDYKGKALVKKIDIEANKTLQNQYQVKSIPGLILFKDGKEIWRHTGLIEFDELSNLLKKHLSTT